MNTPEDEIINRMHTLDQIIYQHHHIAVFPLLKDKTVHGFSWGKDAGNMSFSLGRISEVLKRNQWFFNQLELGAVHDSVVAISEQAQQIILVDEAFLATAHPRAWGIQVAGDVLITTIPNQTLVVKPADCPTAVVSASTGDGKPLVALIHTGWRQTQDQLPEKAITHLVEHFSVPLESIFLGITPHISAQYRTYEHLEEVTDQTMREKYMTFDGTLYHFEDSRYMLDQYLAAGVPSENIEVYNVDTYVEAESGNTFSQKREVNLTREGRPVEKGRYIVAVKNRKP